MAKEIERKFLVKDGSYAEMACERHHICQAYLSTDANATVRVRMFDERGFLTVKSKTIGCTRNEWEYEIPAADAAAMIDCCASVTLEKYRYVVNYGGSRWEVDEFMGKLVGLVVAEIELKEENGSFALPPFVGDEVTGDSRYYNSNLISASYPF